MKPIVRNRMPIQDLWKLADDIEKLFAVQDRSTRFMKYEDELGLGGARIIVTDAKGDRVATLYVGTAQEH